MAAKNIDPLSNKRNLEMGAQSFTDACGVCHAGGGSLEYDRDLNWYGTAGEGSGDAYIIKIQGLGVSADYAKAPEVGYMSSSNKAEMDCLMCHLTDSNPGAAWLRTLGCSNTNPIGPLSDPDCSGAPGGIVDDIPNGVGGYDGLRTLNTDLDTGVAEYDMFNRNFALKQYQPGLAASMGAGAKGTFTDGKLSGINWGGAVNTDPVILAGARIADTPKSENCAVCHARVDNTIGLPGMVNMRSGYGNFDLLYRPDKPVGALAAGQDGQNEDLDTDRGVDEDENPLANDDFFQDFGCKTGMGKRAHKVNAAGDKVGANGRYGMGNMAGVNPGTAIAGKMPDIDVHNTAGMQCATCHYALGSDKDEGYVDIPSRNVHGLVYPAERVYGMDHQFAQSDSFPDTKSKNNLDNGVNCESCHIDRTHPNALTSGTKAAPIPTHTGFPVSHLEKIGCVTCHIPEVYAAPGRLKYRDWSAGFWHHTQKNVLDWNYDLMTGSHNTVPTMHRWASKSSNLAGVHEAKIYPVLPSVLPTWFQEIPNTNIYKAGGNLGTVCLDKDDATVITGIDVTGLAVDANCGVAVAGVYPGQVALYSSVTGNPAQGAKQAGPVKTRDAAMVAEFVRDNGGLNSLGGFTTGEGDGVCGPANTCVGGVNAGDGCSDRTDCTKFDIRLNGGNTFPLFDGFQLADGLEFDTKAEVDAMLAGFKANANGSDAEYATYLNLIQTDFDLTHGIVPVEWALGGTSRGGCVSCHSSKDPMMDMATHLPTNPNYSPNSVGFFEGYVQPVDKAGMMVGGYDLIKNWTAMFADFDCTAFCGMGDPAKNDAYFFNPNNTVNTAATCAANSMFSDPKYASMGGNTINACVAVMTSTFDAAMGFPNGSAMAKGMYDGIAGLQGFTVDTLQTTGSLGCNPFGGATVNGVPSATGSVNACMPAPGTTTPFNAVDGDGNGMNTGVCTAGECVGGWRYDGVCSSDADCRGAMTNQAEVTHNPMGLLLSRKEVRSRQKIDLQQGYKDNDTANPNNIRWSMTTDKNPADGTGSVTWDQANYCIDRNPALYPNPFAPGAISCRSIPFTYAECTTGKGTRMGMSGATEVEDDFAFCASPQSPDGQRHIMNLVTANQFLMYSTTQLADLMQAKSKDDVVLSIVHSQHPTYTCSVCHSDGVAPAGGTNAGYDVVTDASGPEDQQFSFTVNAAGDVTCTSQCHLEAATDVPDDVAIARISAQHSAPGQVDANDVELPVKNFTVNLDGSHSTCYSVDATTGLTTQGTVGYTWTIAGTQPSTTPSDCNAGTGSVTCRAEWSSAGTANVTLAVDCLSGATNSTTVAVSRYDVGAAVNTNPGLTANVSGKTVTVAAPALDTDVGSVTIIWADGTKSVVTAVSTPSIATLMTPGVQHTYTNSGTYKAYVVTTNDGTPDSNLVTYPLTAGATFERITIQ